MCLSVGVWPVYYRVVFVTLWFVIVCVVTASIVCTHELALIGIHVLHVLYGVVKLHLLV